MVGTRISRYESLPIDDLSLDARNPRIAKWIEMYGGEITAEQMALALGAGESEVGSGQNYTTFTSLRESIRANGGIIHPIIVNKANDGRLVVIEGNTRTLIYKEFRDQNQEGNWELIPSIVYEDLSEASVDAIRLQAHLVGPRPWDPYSKAKYLDYLRNCEHLTTEQIVEFCGGNRREVIQYIDAYNDMEGFYRPVLESDQEFDPTRFSAFVELQAPRIQQALLNAGYTKTDFSKWVRDRLLYPLPTIRQLPRILENEKSRQIFLDEGATEALKVLDVPAPDAALRDATFDQLLREVIRHINATTYSQIQRLRERGEPNEVKDLIYDARDQLDSLCSDISSDE